MSISVLLVTIDVENHGIDGPRRLVGQRQERRDLVCARPGSLYGGGGECPGKTGSARIHDGLGGGTHHEPLQAVDYGLEQTEG